jgi:hypothetical protein
MPPLFAGKKDHVSCRQYFGANSVPDDALQIEESNAGAKHFRFWKEILYNRNFHKLKRHFHPELL